jgi:hypothetical protein
MLDRGLAPVQVAAILAQVAIFAVQFAALVARRGVVSPPEIAAQLVAITGYFGFVVTNVAPQAAVACQRRGDTHSHQQEHSSYRAFHIISPAAFRG